MFTKGLITGLFFGVIFMLFICYIIGAHVEAKREKNDVQ